MRKPTITEILLLLIAILLLATAARPYLRPEAAQADAEPYPFFIEPGTQMLRAPDGSQQVLGRVVIDMRNGKVWGFPTNSTSVFPVNSMNSKPPVSHPFAMGRFAFEDTEK